MGVRRTASPHDSVPLAFQTHLHTGTKVLVKNGQNRYTKSMKHGLLTFVLCLLCALPAQAVKFSHTEETYSLAKSRFLVPTLLYKNEITYCIATPAQTPTSPTADQLDILVQAALREWTHGIAVRIRAAGREEEMADILKILDKPLRLIRLSSCNLTSHPQFLAVHPSYNPTGLSSDLTVILSSDYCAKVLGSVNSFFAFQYKNTAPFMCLTQNYANPLRAPAPQGYFPAASDPQKRELLKQTDQIFAQAAAGTYDTDVQDQLWQINRMFAWDGPTYFSVLVHEMGHAFGLGDEYLKDRPQEYASPAPGQGIMLRLYNPISCDEIDGMITLLDRFAGVQRTFASFCSNKTVIQNGKALPVSETIQQQVKKQLLHPAAR